ncbi:MAG: flavodoxin family protein [Actinomycetota bacterium]|nr:flavodoxin family protein [Actinomycetota bacterium]
MKVTLFNCSPRKDGNTYTGLNVIAEELDKESISTEIIQVGCENIYGCDACGICKKTKSGFCKIEDDIVNDAIKKVYDSEGLIIGSPTYFGSITAEAKAFIDRLGYVSRAADMKLSRKVAAGIAIARRAGAVDSVLQINKMFLISGCIIPCSSYWNIAIGREKGEILNDKEGIETFINLARNMSWLLKKIQD